MAPTPTSVSYLLDIFYDLPLLLGHKLTVWFSKSVDKRRTFTHNEFAFHFSATDFRVISLLKWLFVASWTVIYFYQSIKLIIHLGTNQGNRLNDGKSDTPHKSAFRISSTVRCYECTEINTFKCFIGYLLTVTC